MGHFKLKYSRYGDHSILIEWPKKIDETILEDRLNFEESIKLKYTKQKLEIISAYNSILVIYDFTIDNFNDKKNALNQLYLASKDSSKQNSRLWKIPVCYDTTFGTDLMTFSEVKKMPIETVIERHSSSIYTVFFKGFLPGFLYLGGLDKSLHLDRKSTPNLNVQKGSVAIGGNQTGIYPQNSPGGWHIIGRTPVSFFDVGTKPIYFASDGDRIQFQAVSLSEYNAIEKEMENGNYKLQSEPYHG
ncbi:5-oxoprolinase subunit PxpB [Winogradskyella maritima]|uniref:5-oxoprolinase subunit PxpB n=1 Tax=Winogradskyella maritima TaxID=1517766 RepID=A0ABV8AI09_9FLAO|nr:5-oxoprolinase subunit PxpB [Winogradskyella maritima]